MSHQSMVRFIMVLYKKTLSLICDIIKKTYEIKSLEYTSSEKEMMVTLLYKLRQVFVKTREVMYELTGSSYMKTLLKTSEENKGKIINGYNNSNDSSSPKIAERVAQNKAPINASSEDTNKTAAPNNSNIKNSSSPIYIACKNKP